MIRSTRSTPRLQDHESGILPSPRLFLAICLALGSLYAFGPPVQAADLKLEVACSQTTFGLGHPILIGVQITNIGASDYRDLAPVEYYYQYLDVQVTTQGRPLRWTSERGSFAVAGEGIRLRPGEAMCTVVDLTRIFGSGVAISSRAGEPFMLQGLPPGEYTMRIRFRTRTGWLRNVSADVLESEPITFRVASLTELSDADAAALSWIEKIEGDRPLGGGGKKDKLDAVRASAGSGLFPVVWGRLRLTEQDLPLREVIQILKHAGQSSVMQARIANQRVRTHRGNGVDRRKWIERGLADRELVTVRCILNSWRIRAREGKDYRQE